MRITIKHVDFHTEGGLGFVIEDEAEYNRLIAWFKEEGTFDMSMRITRSNDALLQRVEMLRDKARRAGTISVQLGDELATAKSLLREDGWTEN